MDIFKTLENNIYSNSEKKKMLSTPSRQFVAPKQSKGGDGRGREQVWFRSVRCFPLFLWSLLFRSGVHYVYCKIHIKNYLLQSIFVSQNVQANITIGLIFKSIAMFLSSTRVPISKDRSMCLISKFFCHACDFSMFSIPTSFTISFTFNMVLT